MSEDLLVEPPPHTWPHDDESNRTDGDVNDVAVLHHALLWAVHHGWTRIETARWRRDYTIPSRRWTPGGHVIVDWASGSRLSITYRAPILTRLRPYQKWAYSWEDHVTVGSVRQGLAVLLAFDLVDAGAIREAS